MKSFFLSILIMFAAGTVSFAQSGGLIVKSSENRLYVEHTVVPKDNFYSIGRLYNAPPKEIAAFNKLDMTKGLNLGQVVRIPLLPANFSQTVNEGTPVYYKVKENEGLLTVSNANNKVLMENLRKWNHLTNDKIATGNKLVIGFLTTGELAAGKSNANKDAATDKPVVKTEPEKKQAVADKPIAKTEIEKSVTEKKEEVQEKPVVKTETEKPVIIEKREPVVEKPAINTEATKAIPNGQGYFKTFFDQQVKAIPVSKNETVTAGIFKTTSGWTDAKYYALIDGVQSGTVIKIANPSNNKVVYAKVLGEMSGIRQNEGYNIRISSAAASALQVTEQDKFIVSLNY